MCIVPDIWKSFESSNARSSYNINVPSIGHSHVFIGILWIKGDGGPYVEETGRLIIVPTIIVQNTMKQQAFAPMEMSEYTFFG